VAREVAAANPGARYTNQDLIADLERNSARVRSPAAECSPTTRTLPPKSARGATGGTGSTSKLDLKTGLRETG
jgi:hypothetical protein